MGEAASAGGGLVDRSLATYVIVLKLTPAFSAQLAVPGVVEAIAAASAQARAPPVEQLVGLGQSPEFARVFSERLAYLVRLKQAGVLRAAGPFEGLAEGLYLVSAPDEVAARRVLEEDPLYRAGFIAREYTLQRWLVAI